MNGEVIPITTMKAIVDSGTSFIVIPEPELAFLISVWSRVMMCDLDEMSQLY
jgi:hypothetical protein